jgi:hypothetical protein
MDLVLDLLATVSRWSRSHLSEISLALIGCVLVLFGADFKGWVEHVWATSPAPCASR